MTKNSEGAASPSTATDIQLVAPLLNASGAKVASTPVQISTAASTVAVVGTSDKVAAKTPGCWAAFASCFQKVEPILHVLAAILIQSATDAIQKDENLTQAQKDLLKQATNDSLTTLADLSIKKADSAAKVVIANNGDLQASLAAAGGASSIAASVVDAFASAAAPLASAGTSILSTQVVDSGIQMIKNLHLPAKQETDAIAKFISNVKAAQQKTLDALGSDHHAAATFVYAALAGDKATLSNLSKQAADQIKMQAQNVAGDVIDVAAAVAVSDVNKAISDGVSAAPLADALATSTDSSIASAAGVIKAAIGVVPAQDGSSSTVAAVAVEASAVVMTGVSNTAHSNATDIVG